MTTGVAAADGAREFDRRAIARIDVLDAAGKSVSRGTGTLIAPGLVLTALHVVAFRKSEALTPKGASIRLTFPEFQTIAAIVGDSWDPKDDWALLECADEPTMPPMPLAALQESGRDWLSFGYPDAQSLDGMLVNGQVTLCEGQFEGVPAHQLYCDQAASGAGGMSKGLSGAPCVVDGAVVGVMRAALMQQDRTEMGTLYASPVRNIRKKRNDIPVGAIERQDPQKLSKQLSAVISSQGWQLPAFFGALAMISATLVMLQSVRVSSAILNAEVAAHDVQFAFAKPTALPLQTARDWLELKSLRVSGADYATFPNRRGGRSEATSPSLVRFETDGVPRGHVSPIAFDLQAPFPAGTHVLLHSAGYAGRFRMDLSVDSATTPLLVRLVPANGVVRMTAGDSSVTFAPGKDATDLAAADDSVKIFPRAGGSISAEFDLPEGTVVTLRDATTVSDVEFMGIERDAANHFIRVPSIDTGQLLIDAPNPNGLRLEARDSLAFAKGQSFMLSQLGMRADGTRLTVRFGGTATGLTLGRVGVTRHEMPTWLDHLRRQYAITSAAIAGLVLLGFAWLIQSWRKRKYWT